MYGYLNNKSKCLTNVKHFDGCFSKSSGTPKFKRERIFLDYYPRQQFL